ncbi:MAG: DUF6390 family protein [Pseudonocardiaceae bacterium]
MTAAAPPPRCSDAPPGLPRGYRAGHAQRRRPRTHVIRLSPLPVRRYHAGLAGPDRSCLGVAVRSVHGDHGETSDRPPGALLFARYAFPPNELGYCGPADSQELLGYGATGVVDRGLAALARQFDGAWPYLELIAGAVGIPDPLDHRVVEAYWVGNPLLDRVGTAALGNSMDERLRRRTGRQFTLVADGVLAGGVPHHSFHVFGVYPWVGLLSNDRIAGQALEVLDRCRIRWGKVDNVTGDQVLVRSQPLTWDGRHLRLGEPVLETARRAIDGSGFVDQIAPGDWISLHWDWVCDRLSPRQLADLRRYSRRQLTITNDEMTRSGPATVLG